MLAEKHYLRVLRFDGDQTVSVPDVGWIPIQSRSSDSRDGRKSAAVSPTRVSPISAESATHSDVGEETFAEVLWHEAVHEWIDAAVRYICFVFNLMLLLSAFLCDHNLMLLISACLCDHNRNHINEWIDAVER